MLSRLKEAVMRYIIINGRRVYITLSKDGVAVPHYVRDGGRIKPIR